MKIRNILSCALVSILLAQFFVLPVHAKSVNDVPNDFIDFADSITESEEIVEDSVQYLPDGVEVHTIVTMTKPVFVARSNEGTTTVTTTKAYKLNGLTLATFKIVVDYWFDSAANEVGYTSYKSSCTRGAYAKADPTISSTPDETTGTDFLTGHAWVRLTFSGTATGKSSNGEIVTKDIKIYNEIQSDGKTKSGLTG